MQPKPSDLERLRNRLRHVHWIGGGSGAGKSTIARQLAASYVLRLYDTDGAMAVHTTRSTPADAPLLQAFLAMDMDERWANRSPDVMRRTFPWFAGEAFDLIVEDLLALPADTPILAEGFRLLPRLVAPLLAHNYQAVWLVPTPEFRRAAFDNRGSTWKIAKKTSKPEQALSNLLVRDQLFTEEVAKEATALQLRVIEVAGTVSVDEMLTRVAGYFELSEH
jgi:hypothetical protein